jgi:CRISPR/Cas system-associated exonuclease Cas4 (RecB family)
MVERRGIKGQGTERGVLRLRTPAWTEGLSEEERRLWVERVSDHLQSGKAGELEAKYKNKMKMHVLSHNRRAAVASVMEKRGYWFGEREPTSSTSTGKCRACEYSSVCPKSLFKGQ